MDDNDLRLDGNAAGGLLGELFPFEMTMAECTCTRCGVTAPVGALILYRHGMGAILRCAGCDTVQIRLSRTPGRYWIDMRGIESMRIAASQN
ncbi:MAG: DUF6510 family protein [Chloroflexota bacterium]|nr:DUF6510 family protein [Chloroflexota bacterium]